MKIAFDLDGTITDAPEFFSTLSKLWNDDVYVITYRDNRPKAVADLAALDIWYTEVFLVNSFEEKADIVRKMGIGFYFDDMPEMLKQMPPEAGICLFRNPGNFDFDDRLWMLSNETGKLV